LHPPLVEVNQAIISLVVLVQNIDPIKVHTVLLGVPVDPGVQYVWDYFSFFFLGQILFSKKGLSLDSEILHRVLRQKRMSGVNNIVGPPPQLVGEFFWFKNKTKQKMAQKGWS
jgi:hypothetical protein